jgi:HAD superfamily hydrolase (TIGR01509 family)
VDSSAHHARAWEQLAAELGRPLTPGYFERGFGLKNERIIPEILGWAVDESEVSRISRRKEQLYREALRAGGLSLLPGVRSFLDALRERGIPCAVGSSSHRRNIEAALELLDLEGFQAMITAEDVSAGKPDPEVFLLAARSIAVPPSRCVVFEDVPAGVEAAHRGGMKAVAVTTTHPERALSRADVVVHRLDELSPANLEELVDAAGEEDRAS